MKKAFFILLSILPFCIASVVQAQGYTPIVGLPGVDVNALSTEGYVNALYRLSITVACLLALLKIIFGGVKWTLSDVVTDKGDAKKDIKGALLGLLIVLSAVLILNTINPNLTQLNIFGEGAPSIDAIEAARNEVNVSFGDSINSALATPAEVARFGESCLSGGGTISRSEVVRNRAGGTATLSRCVANPANINAQIGDTFDASLYPPGTDESRFEQTCEDAETGGRYETNGIYSSSCEPTAIPIGNRLDVATLENLSVAERTEAILNFQSECSGEASEVVDENDVVTFLVCE